MTKQTYWKKNWSCFTVPKHEFIIMKDAWKCERRARRWEPHTQLHTWNAINLRCGTRWWILNADPFFHDRFPPAKLPNFSKQHHQLGTACSNVRAHGDTGLQTTTSNSRPHRLKATLSCKTHLINLKVYIIFPIQLEL